MPYRIGLITLLLAACGDDTSTDEVEMLLSIPLPQSTECPQRSKIASDVEAVLDISGNQSPCPLRIDRSQLTANGTCENITGEDVRYLMVTYWLPPDPSAGTGRADLAYHVTFVDLIGIDSGEVNVNFLVGEPNNQVIDEEPEFDALPENPPDSASPFEQALGWARAQIKDGAVLDLDQDGCGNMQEACASQLFPADDTNCPP